MKGLPAAAVFHLVQQGEDASPKERMIAQYITKFVGEAMVEHGILVSNSNRFYGNISVNQEDVDLFEDRVGKVFESVNTFLQKMRG